MNPPSRKKSGLGILTGNKSVLSSRSLLSGGAYSKARGSSQDSNLNLTLTESDEEDNELKLYLSQTKKESVSKIDWSAITEDADAMSEFKFEQPKREDDYFLKPKMQRNSSGDKEYQNDPHDSAPKLVIDKTFVSNSTSDLDEMSGDPSLPSSPNVLKGNIYMLDKFEEEKALEANASLSDTSMPVESSNDEITSKSMKSSQLTPHSVSSEILVSDKDTSGVNIEESIENGYSSDFEDSLESDEDLLTMSQSTMRNSEDHQISSNNSSIAINVISDLSSLNNSEHFDKSTETSMQYTTDFTSVSESHNTSGENFLPDQRTSLQRVAIGTQYDCPITSNAGTQTLLGGMDFSTHPTQSCSLGPPKYSTDYHDPTPLVIHRDLIDALTAYSPNSLALKDMMRSQLTLTRKLLDTNAEFLESVSASLTPDYKYTTLEDTRSYIQQHRPKILTLQEAKKKHKHKP